jgi:hypothetical protein
VTAEAAAVEPRQAAGVLVSGKALVELPINGRDFARFSLLSPGAVARSSGLSDLAFNGLHPAHNNITMDGVDANRGDQATLSDGFGRGARLLTGSLETMAEFRVQSNNYRAEYGRAAGSTITIATRGGTNTLHGGLFEFFRNNVLDARNFFNIDTQAKDQFRYNNFGGNLGGPLRKNRTSSSPTWSSPGSGKGFAGRVQCRLPPCGSRPCGHRPLSHSCWRIFRPGKPQRQIHSLAVTRDSSR